MSYPKELDFREMREMLRAMQAGELTVSRGIEILEMWQAGNWNDDMLPPVRQDLIEEDSMPVEIIDRLTEQRNALLDSLEDAQDIASKALRKAWQLGQTYWQQADSEYQSHWSKASVTQSKFQELVDETRSAIMKGNSYS